MCCLQHVRTATDDADVCCSDSSATAARVNNTKVAKVAAAKRLGTAKVHAKVSVPEECVVCNTCGGGFDFHKATLISQAWSEYASLCSGDSKTTTSSDNAYVCCLNASSQVHLVHV